MFHIQKGNKITHMYLLSQTSVADIFNLNLSKYKSITYNVQRKLEHL